MTEDKKISRRRYLKYTAAGAAVAVAAAAGYGVYQATQAPSTAPKTETLAPVEQISVVIEAGSGQFEHVRKYSPDWTAQSGIKVNLVELPNSYMREKEILDLSSPSPTGVDPCV
jgi:ABC-type glycerol-3-phosphate transport system substrate-binding protein